MKARCLHVSHSILAAELGKEEKAVEMYQRTARLDLDNYNTTPKTACTLLL